MLHKLRLVEKGCRDGEGINIGCRDEGGTKKAARIEEG